MQRQMFLYAVALCGVAATHATGDIVQDTGVFDRAIASFDPIGQTFTAVDAQVSTIAFAFSDINPGFPNDPVTMSLYEGSGFGGILLASVSQTLPGVLPDTLATPQFIDFDFSGVMLTVGSTYTVAVTTSSSPKVAVVYSGANPYGFGNYISGVDGANAAFDLNFRVLGVPGPATGLSLTIGTVLSTRRRRTA